jgi:membrane protein DedA with SNARE-associated domain
MTLEAIIARYGLMALFLGAGVEGETVVVAGGVLVHKHLLPFPQAIAAAAAGSFLADQIFFAIGRRFRDHPRVRRITAKPAFARAYAMLEHHPVGFVLAFRFLYGLRIMSPLAIGTSAMPMRRFVPLNAAAAIVWATSFVILGALFGNALDRVFGQLSPAGHALIAAGAVALGLIGTSLVLHRLHRPSGSPS